MGHPMPVETIVKEAKTEENDIMSEEVNKSVFRMFREMSAGKKPVFVDESVAKSNLDELHARLERLSVDKQETALRRRY
jgi:hypothetical protein